VIIIEQSARSLKSWLQQACLGKVATRMVMRMVLAFMLHRGRMSCSAAGGMIASHSVHRGQVTRFLCRPCWRRVDHNAALREALLRQETARGKFLFLVDATMSTQAGLKTQNTFSTGHRKRRPKKGRRYNQKKTIHKKVHSFTFGLLITPSGFRIPFHIPHYTKEYCRARGIAHQTTAECAAQLIRDLPLPDEAEVIVLGDTAYDAKVVREACADRDYSWIVPANPERVYEGPTGQRPQLRSRLKDWKGLSLETIRLRASTGKYAGYRRLSRWRVGPKQKPRVYYATQENCAVRRVGDVRLIFSTMKPNLQKATPNDVKILMTNATQLSLGEVLELYAIRWQIELFFKELKSTLGVCQYQFEQFSAVEGWMDCAMTTVLFLETLRAKRLADRRLSEQRRRWWEAQRLHGLCAAFRQECCGEELKYLNERLKTSGGIQKMKRLLTNALPQEFRVTT
jgi:hypothetical protein